MNKNIVKAASNVNAPVRSRHCDMSFNVNKDAVHSDYSPSAGIDHLCEHSRECATQLDAERIKWTFIKVNWHKGCKVCVATVLLFYHCLLNVLKDQMFRL